MIPLGKRVIIKDIVTEETMPGGRIIQLEDSRLEKTKQQAEVVACGDGCELGLAPGDWIIHGPHCRSAGPEDGTYLVWEDDIVGKVEW